MITSKNIKNIGEKQYAQYLESKNIKYIYQPDFIIFSNRKGDRYRPDFYLPNENLYIEVVNTRQAFYLNLDKIKSTILLNYNILVVKPNGKIYRSNEFVLNFKHKNIVDKSKLKKCYMKPLTIKEASVILNRRPEMIRKLCHNGKLGFYKRKNRLITYHFFIDQYINQIKSKEK